METSSEITIQFVLRKGDGNWPSVEELSKEETEDLTRIGRFFLDFDDQNNSLLGTPITKVEIIYDGISFLNESRIGLRVLNGELQGYPSPVLKFNFQTKVCVATFIETVWHSFMLLTPSCRINEDGYCCEDHQGYTFALNQFEVSSLTAAVQKGHCQSYKSVSLSELQSGVNLYGLKIS